MIDIPQPTRQPVFHVVKSWPIWFEAVFVDEKQFEVRKDDRNYQKNDNLIMLEWEPDAERYTGREIRAEVAYKLGDNCDGITTGYCVLGLKNIERSY